MDGADLSNAQLYQTDLTGASLKRAVVTGGSLALRTALTPRRS